MDREKLALDGGTPAVTRAARRGLIGEEERQAVLAAVDRAIAEDKSFDRYDGVEVLAYEAEFAKWLGVRYATAVSTGTAAIHAALAPLHLEPGCEVVCSPITDPGAVAPVLWNQCIPVFADTAPDTFNVTAATIEAVLTDRTRAIVVGHITGEPCVMDEIVALAKRRGLPLVEDCAQAHGATYRGRMVGTFGSLSAFSMMSCKTHTSGGQGGMVATDDEALYWDAKRFADRGKPFNTPERTNIFLGMNYRMAELQAAVGRVQLRRVPAIVARRQAMGDRLAGHLANTAAFSLGAMPDGVASAYFFLRAKVDLPRLTADKEQLAKALTAEGVAASPTYTSLIYRQKWFADRSTLGHSHLPWSLPGVPPISYDNACPNAERALAEHLFCSFHEGMDEEHIDAMGLAFQKVDRAYRTSGAFV
jgi:dTDP-4-amino-4,6-dideoxygalactose transaminase